MKMRLTLNLQTFQAEKPWPSQQKQLNPMTIKINQDRQTVTFKR